MLPWWIEHHRKVFSNALLLNYASSDRSVEIIRDMAPRSWKIIESRNKNFTPSEIDQEVMELERTVSGTKIVLNTTEFLVGTIRTELFGTNRIAGRTGGVVMVDPHPANEPVYNSSLVEQKPFGITTAQFDSLPKLRFDRPQDLRRHFLSYGASGTFQSLRRRKHLAFWNPLGRARVIHNFPDGQYLPGRHLSKLESLDLSQELQTLWFAGSPWTPSFISRKLAVKDLIPLASTRNGQGSNHLLTESDLSYLHSYYSGLTEELRQVKLEVS